MPPSSRQTLLLVDGYNVIGAWSSLKKTRDHHGLLAARQELIEALINYSTFKGFEAQVVFDAQYQNTPGYREVHTSYLSVYYTAHLETADTYIERVCASYQRQLYRSTPRLIVATSDRAQQLVVIGYGAESMSALQLAGEVELTASQRRRKQQSQNRSRGRFLIHSLDANAQQRLAQWRQGLR